jgi:hypothetical protein
MSTPPSRSGSELGDRIAAVKSSLRCFVYSLIGLVPLIGIPFSIAAIVRGRQVPGADGGGWNPGDRYLKAARRLGPFGFLSTAIFLVVVCVGLPALLGGGCGGGSGHG